MLWISYFQQQSNQRDLVLVKEQEIIKKQKNEINQSEKRKQCVFNSRK